MEGGTGEATFTAATPGDMTALRLSFCWRARDAKDSFDVQVSYDKGQTFTSMTKLTGPAKGMTKYLVVKDIPAGTREAQIKLIGAQVNTAAIFDMRIDADYREPNGGFRPVKVTYVWDEAGQAKQDVHVVKSASETYTINCGPKAVVKSYTVELAE
jgi:hypothetical protein